MRNWKTTLTGIILACMVAIQPLTEGEIDIKRDWHKFILAIGIAALGYLAKDHDVTGVQDDDTK